MKKRKTDTLTLLGKTIAEVPKTPGKAKIETFENRYPKRDYEVTIDSPDFTSLCPVTGQPDFARIVISYVPDRLCVETKSLKMYLAAFRNEASFNEEIVNRILEDLVKVVNPRRMTVHGEFAARGGISLSISAQHPDHKD